MVFIYNDPSGRPTRRKLRSSQTDAEKRLWQSLRGKQLFGYRFLRQYGVGRYILDFYCPAARLGIELDGGQHAEKNVGEYDQERTGYLESKNIKILRFWNNEVFENLTGVLEKICLNLTPPASPYAKGRL